MREFKPLSNYRSEYPYQAELAQWLRSRFPGTKIEEQRGSSRPDIVVNGVAIEVKGPTSDKDLESVNGKLSRYPQWFPKGIVVVLFGVNVNAHFYDEWHRGIIGTQFPGNPRVEIIKGSRVSKTDAKPPDPSSGWQHEDKPLSAPLGSSGFCIRCGKEIKLYPKVPYCRECYKSWNKNKNYEEKLCHVCGKSNKSTLLRPACYNCYNAKKGVLEFPI